jgi:hypothetical protein
MLNKKYAGQTFADISKDIESKYKERYDRISLKGLNAEMGKLQKEQEYTKEKMALEESIRNPQQGGKEAQMQSPEMGVPQMDTNQGVVPQMPQQDTGTFNRAASQQYNEKFANGGEMNSYLTGGEMALASSLLGSGGGNSGGGMGSGLLRLAPTITKGILLRNLEQEDPFSRRFVNTSELDNLRQRVNVRPQQTTFRDIDMSQIERGINEQGQSFTQANRQASAGNAASFLANEQANAANRMRAIGQARMQGQQMSQKTQAMNAQERARLDNISMSTQQTNAQLAMQQAQARVQGRAQNVGLANQYDMIDMQNRQAYNSMRMQLISGIGDDIGNMGREAQQSRMVGMAHGYNYNPWTGQYNWIGGDKDTNDSLNGGMINSIRQKRYANGGLMQDGPGKGKVVVKTPSGGTGMDVGKNPNYIYSDANVEGVGGVQRFIPAYSFQGQDAKQQEQKVLAQGKKDAFEKDRSNFWEQYKTNKVDTTMYSVTPDGQVILNKGNVLLGNIDKAEYKKQAKKGKEVYQYRTNQNAYGGRIKSVINKRKK